MLVFEYFGVGMKVDILQAVQERHEHFKYAKISILSEYDFNVYFALYLNIKNDDFTGGLWWTVTYVLLTMLGHRYIPVLPNIPVPGT